MAIDTDLPLARSLHGLLSTNLVIGAQALGWVGKGPNGGPSIALRENFYPATWLVQVTAGVIDRLIDFDLPTRWQWDRVAIMVSISIGPIVGNYPFKCLGVPRPALLD